MLWLLPESQTTRAWILPCLLSHFLISFCEKKSYIIIWEVIFALDIYKSWEPIYIALLSKCTTPIGSLIAHWWEDQVMLPNVPPCRPKEIALTAYSTTLSPSTPSPAGAARRKEKGTKTYPISPASRSLNHWGQGSPYVLLLRRSGSPE